MLSGPGGGGCKLSDDWDRDGAESLLDDDGRVPLAACFLVRGILGGFWMGPYGRARQRCRRRVPIMATWRGVYWPWEHLRLVTTNYNYYRRGVCLECVRFPSFAICCATVMRVCCKSTLLGIRYLFLLYIFVLQVVIVTHYIV